jgi:hypothetical protein
MILASTKIVVVIEQGKVKEIIANDTVELTVMDCDIKGADPSDLIPVPMNGKDLSPVLVDDWQVDIKPVRVREVLRAVTDWRAKKDAGK